jgi:predicted RNase H-like HicB family nuclease
VTPLPLYTIAAYFIRCLLGAKRLTTSGFSRHRVSASKLASPLAADPRQLYFFNLEGKTMKLKIVLEPSDEGGFTVYVPSLPGCISEGDTKEEAMANIKEAIELYLEPVEDDLTSSPDLEILEIAV